MVACNLMPLSLDTVECKMSGGEKQCTAFSTRARSKTVMSMNNFIVTQEGTVVAGVVGSTSTVCIGGEEGGKVSACPPEL